MLQKVIGYATLVTATIFLMALGGKESDYITYEWLTSNHTESPSTDHIAHFRRLFNTTKVRGFLECGCGYATKYFLDHSEKVISIEFMTPGTGFQWFHQCLKLFKGCSNWLPLSYNADWQSESFNKACAYQCSYHKDYALIDPRYLVELDQYFKKLLQRMHLEGKDIDVALVKPNGIYIRGDMVKVLLANKVPIVVAHDTASDVGSDVDEGLYGWFKVRTPPDYEKIYIPWGQGTTFWVSKSLPKVIDSLIAYRDRIVLLIDQSPNQKAIPYSRLTELADQ